MKKIATFLSFLFFAVPLFSFDMILAGDPVLEDLRFLSLKSGRSFLSFTPPLAPAEVRRFLDSVGEAELGPSAMEAYRRARARLAPVSRISFTDDNFSRRLNMDTTLEAEARFNSQVSWYPRYQQITPLVSAPLTGSFMNTVQLYFEPIIAKGRRDELHDYFRASIPSGFGHGQFNTEMSVRAFAAAGGSWWNFQIGRDRLFWGTGHTGSMIFADNSPYFDFARISFFSRNVKYSVIVNQMPLRLSRHLFPDDWDDWWIEHTGPDGVIDPRNIVLQRYFYLQRLDVRLFNRLSIGIMEGIMVGNAPLEIRYLNPLLFFHSLYAWNDFPDWAPNDGDMVGSFFSVEANWNITRNWAVYGQFAMNEFSLPGETDGHPDAMGWMLGVQFAHSFNNWGSVSFLEIVRTDPFLGILSTPYASFIQMDRLDFFAPGFDRMGNYYSIGSPRDMVSIAVGTNFFNRNTLSLSGRLSWIAMGEHNRNNSVIWNWGSGPPYTEQRSPTGTAQHQFILSTGSTWRPHHWLTLSAGITGIVSLNNRHRSDNTQVGGQVSLSAGFHL